MLAIVAGANRTFDGWVRAEPTKPLPGRAEFGRGMPERGELARGELARAEEQARVGVTVTKAQGARSEEARRLYAETGATPQVERPAQF